MFDMRTRKNQIIYCVVVVISLIIIFFGDQIIIKTIPFAPNPNNKFVGGETKHLTFEGINATEISLEDVLTKMGQKESFYVMSLRTDCFRCNELMEQAKNKINEANFPVYYIDRDKYDNQNIALISFKTMDLRIEENIDLTPIAISIQEGTVNEVLIGVPSAEKIDTFFQNL